MNAHAPLFAVKVLWLLHCSGYRSNAARSAAGAGWDWSGSAARSSYWAHVCRHPIRCSNLAARAGESLGSGAQGPHHPDRDVLLECDFFRGGVSLLVSQSSRCVTLALVRKHVFIPQSSLSVHQIGNSQKVSAKVKAISWTYSKQSICLH